MIRLKRILEQKSSYSNIDKLDKNFEIKLSSLISEQITDTNQAGKTVDAAAADLHDSMDWLGTDEDLLFATLKAMADEPAWGQQVIDRFNSAEKYSEGDDLNDWLDGDLSGNDLTKAKAYIKTIEAVSSDQQESKSIDEKLMLEIRENAQQLYGAPSEDLADQIFGWLWWENGLKILGVLTIALAAGAGLERLGVDLKNTALGKGVKKLLAIPGWIFKKAWISGVSWPLFRGVLRIPSKYMPWLIKFSSKTFQRNWIKESLLKPFRNVMNKYEKESYEHTKIKTWIDNISVALDKESDTVDALVTSVYNKLKTSAYEVLYNLRNGKMSQYATLPASMEAGFVEILGDLYRIDPARFGKSFAEEMMTKLEVTAESRSKILAELEKFYPKVEKESETIIRAYKELPTAVKELPGYENIYNRYSNKIANAEETIELLYNNIKTGNLGPGSGLPNYFNRIANSIERPSTTNPSKWYNEFGQYSDNVRIQIGWDPIKQRPFDHAVKRFQNEMNRDQMLWDLNNTMKSAIK